MPRRLARSSRPSSRSAPRGWLFPVWDRVGRVDMTALRAAIRTVTEAIGILRAARIQVAICLIPSKKRMMRQSLPANVTVIPEAAQRYSLTIAETTRAGAVSPDLDAVFRAQLQREPGRNLYFKTDTHWTPMGAELAWCGDGAADARADAVAARFVRNAPG